MSQFKLFENCLYIILQKKY